MVKLRNPSSYQCLKGRFETSKRQGSRLLAIDEHTSTLLWDRIKANLSSIMAEKAIPTTPLGFDVSTGNWKVDGVNEALRLNLYNDSSNFFAPHIDAQYCPNGDKRSLFSVVLYLTDSFDGGETMLYFPKGPSTPESALQYKGLTIDEEISARGGLKEGFDTFSIKPKKGRAIIFSHNIIHEAKPLKAPFDGAANVTKIVVRTDIMVKRVVGARGFIVSEPETKDYQMALSFFREAQQMELEKNPEKAGELYERCLSIRYSYPQCLAPQSKIRPVAVFERLPTEILVRVAETISALDCQKLVLAFPNLFWMRQVTERHLANRLRNSKAINEIIPLPKDPTDVLMPEMVDVSGISCGLIFQDAAYFRENIEAFCRAAAMLAFFQFGHCKNPKAYTVSYNPVTQEVTAVDFKDVVAAAFYNRPLYGSIFKVYPQTKGQASYISVRFLEGTFKLSYANQVNPAADFNHCVDRSYMSCRFGSQFIGTDFPRNRHAYVTQHPDDEDNHYSYVGDEEDNGEAVIISEEAEEESEAESNNEGSEADFDSSFDACSSEILVDGFRVLTTPFDRNFYAENSAEHLFASFGRIQQEFTLNGTNFPFREVEALYELRKRGVINDYREAVLHPQGGKREKTTLVDFIGSVHQCFCDYCIDYFTETGKISRPINDLVFDFSRYDLKVMPDETLGDAMPESCSSCPGISDRPGVIFGTDQNGEAEVLKFKVDISPLPESDCFESFSHAAARCYFYKIDGNVLYISGYDHLNHVHLRCQEKEGKMLVYAAYGGIVAL
ncbi:hypothetical protein HDU97_002440 [Phlyctochytrium planicorne]|nr:hypothetical protein HDU97_002440 [Phlyctochytrium planicorne]